MTEFRSRRTSYATHYSKLYRAGHRLTVSPLGTCRRVQALRAIGYTTPVIAAETGLSESFLTHLSSEKQVRVGLYAHRKIAAFYDTHCAVPQTGHSANKARTWAKKYGWAPPMAWDDIDSPTDYPKGVLA